jgi:hypothetical protein
MSVIKSRKYTKVLMFLATVMFAQLSLADVVPAASDTKQGFDWVFKNQKNGAISAKTYTKYREKMLQPTYGNDSVDTKKTIEETIKRRAGAVNGGGGDHYTLDYLVTATQHVYPFLKSLENKDKLPVGIAEKFLASVDPSRIYSSDSDVYESCDGSASGRTVEACYNADYDFFVLSRSRYPLQTNSKAEEDLKNKLIMHEQFRRMGYEGDEYELTRLIDSLFVVYNPLKITFYQKTENEDGSSSFVLPRAIVGQDDYSIYVKDSRELHTLCRQLGFQTSLDVSMAAAKDGSACMSIDSDRKRFVAIPCDKVVYSFSCHN